MDYGFLLGNRYPTNKIDRTGIHKVNLHVCSIAQIRNYR